MLLLLWQKKNNGRCVRARVRACVATRAREGAAWGGYRPIAGLENVECIQRQGVCVCVCVRACACVCVCVLFIGIYTLLLCLYLCLYYGFAIIDANYLTAPLPIRRNPLWQPACRKVTPYLRHLPLVAVIRPRIVCSR